MTMTESSLEIRPRVRPRPRTRARARARILLPLSLLLLLCTIALAEPVPIGRYVEIPIGVSQRSPYAMSGGDARRTGRSRARAPAQAPSRLWSVVLPQRELVPPVVLEDGTLIVGSAGGVHAIDPASGEQRWYAPIGALRYTPSLTPNGELAAIAGGKLVLVGEQG